MNELEQSDTHEVMEIILQQAGNIIGIEPNNIRLKRCSEHVLATTVMVAINTEIPEADICLFYASDKAWLETLKNLFDNFNDNEKEVYQNIYENAQGSIMVALFNKTSLTEESALNGAALKMRDISEQPHTKGVCEEVVEVVSVYFEVSQDVIRNPTTPDEKTYRSKSVLVMKKAHATTEEIQRFFGESEAWVNAQINVVDPEDGDVDMIERNLFSPQVKPEPEIVDVDGASDVSSRTSNSFTENSLAHQILIAGSVVSGLDVKTLLTDKTWFVCKQRAICAKAMELAGVPLSEIASLFNKTKSWCSYTLHKIDEDSILKAKEILATVKPEVVSQEQSESESTVRKPERVPSDPDTTMKKIAEKVFPQFCTSSILLEDPTFQINLMKNVMLYLSLDQMTFTDILSTSGLSEDEVLRKIGFITVRIKTDPAFAMKVQAAAFE